MTHPSQRRHDEIFTRRRTVGKKTNAKVRAMIAVLPSAPSSPLVMAALAALAGAAPTTAWSQGTAPAAPAVPAASATVGAPVPLLPPAPRAASAQTTQRDAMMMTDTPEYCASLGGRVEDMARGVKVSAETEDLLREGQRLCEGGKTRVGVQHLRRAYILLRQASTGP